MTSKVTNDRFRGGVSRIIMTAGGKEIPHAGTYLEIDPHSPVSPSPGEIARTRSMTGCRHHRFCANLSRGSPKSRCIQVKFRSGGGPEPATRWLDSDPGIGVEEAFG